MSLEALAQHFGLGVVPEIVPPTPTSPVSLDGNIEEALLQIYNPHTDSHALKARPKDFEWLRGNYPHRREETAYGIHRG